MGRKELRKGVSRDTSALGYSAPRTEVIAEAQGDTANVMEYRGFQGVTRRGRRGRLH